MSDLIFWLLVAGLVVLGGGILVTGYRAEVRRERAREERGRRLWEAVERIERQG